jgi:hypothetical protein
LEAEECIGGAWSRQNLSEVDGLIKMCWQVERSECQNVLQADEALEAEGCVRGSSMHRRSMEADRAAGADGAGGEYKMSEAVKVVRTC